MRRLLAIGPLLASALAIHAVAASPLAPVAVATAQDWVVLPASAASASTATAGTAEAPDTATVLALEDALSVAGVATFRGDALAAQIEARLSREPRGVDERAVSDLVEAVQELELLVATRQREAALTQAERVRALSDGTVDALSGQRELARTIFAGCLADGWLHLQLHEPEVARQRLLACRQLHPDVPVQQATVAPPVYSLLQSVDQEMASQVTHSLTIDTGRVGCTVLLNGREATTTPAPIAAVALGTYQIEVRCPGLPHSRVHTVAMIAADRSIPLDPVLDDALRTRDGDVQLVFPSRTSLDTNGVEIAVRLATVVGARGALLITPGPEAGSLRADRIMVGTGIVASVILSGPADAQAAAQALVAARSVDVRGGLERPLPDAPRAEAPTERASGPDPVPGYVGIALASIGGLALLAGLGTAVAWDADVHAYHGLDPTLGTAFAYHQRAAEEQIASTVASAAGGALFALAVPLWLPAERDVPWWSWVLGGVGIAGLATSAVAFVEHIDLQSPRFATCNCFERQYYLAYGAVVLGASAALVSIPLTHLLRLAVGPLAPVPVVDVDSEQASLGVRGTW